MATSLLSHLDFFYRFEAVHRFGLHITPFTRKKQALKMATQMACATPYHLLLTLLLLSLFVVCVCLLPVYGWDLRFHMA
ncbi:hypothetical protein L1987_11174 [Smallanthus sonchifolius]|uniref:Uncharacterized protein n=1 Tax=Smallanthus sonchifolius TaxID=185202 RepID=A0ACB9JB29_9ASTR|nr:hypothetical protein L1987_11174 [Smallanthus sonchifolius]